MDFLFTGWMNASLAAFFGTVTEAILLALVGYFVIKVFVKILKRLLAKTHLDPTLTVFTAAVVRIILIVLLVLMVLGCLHVEMGPVLTALGSVGLALSLALQDSLKNIAGGVYLLFAKAFSVHDYVEIGSNAGSVLEIGLVNTRLRTPDGKHIFVPNGDVAKSVIVNYSVEENRRLDLLFSIAYEDDIERAQKIILQILSKHRKVLAEPAPLVRVASLSSSSVDLTCYVWVKAENIHEVGFDLREQVKKAFDDNGISIPFPQMELHVKAEEKNKD